MPMRGAQAAPMNRMPFRLAYLLVLVMYNSQELSPQVSKRFVSLPSSPLQKPTSREGNMLAINQDGIFSGPQRAGKLGNSDLCSKKILY